MVSNICVRDIDTLINIVAREFPSAGIRVTSRGRTPLSQAELMADRIRANRQEFLTTYARRRHIIEMDQWILQNPNASRDQTVARFDQIIRHAVARGDVVSNHLSNAARDIAWPNGSAQTLNEIQERIEALGATVLREPRAQDGRHWHIDW